MRTPRPKQPTNPIPEVGSRWVCDPRQHDAGDGTQVRAPRIVVVTRTYYDDVRKDTRIEYANESTKRNGASWYEKFKSGAEFTPAPPKEAQPAPVVPPSPTTQGQVPLMLGYRPADPALLAVLGRIATALEPPDDANQAHQNLPVLYEIMGVLCDIKDALNDISSTLDNPNGTR